MKELSIEQKARRYDEAIKRIENIKTGKCETTFMFTEGLFEHIFPELAESEDEKIRKEMIFYFTEEIPQCSIQEHSDKMRVFISWLKKQEVERTKLELKAGSSYFCYKSRYERADNETFKKGLIYKCNKDGVLDNFVIKNPEQHFIEIKDERIAWLEKQGEHNKWKPSKDEMNALYGLSYITNKMDDKKDESITKLYQDLKREFFNGTSYENMFPSSPVDSDINIEKQDKQQDVNIQINPSEYINDMGGNGCYLKNTVQKPADKVEPKFKVGDWVIDKSFGNIKQIKHFDNDEKVWFTDGTGTFIEFLEGYRLWTIKDAKDGDVLADGNLPFIFKKIDSNKYSYAYCGISVDNGFKIESDGESGEWTWTQDIKPATKEQRDTLERAMTKAGYRWDKEKLKLEKYERSVFATNRYR